MRKLTLKRTLSITLIFALFMTCEQIDLNQNRDSDSINDPSVNSTIKSISTTNTSNYLFQEFLIEYENTQPKNSTSQFKNSIESFNNAEIKIVTLNNEDATNYLIATPLVEVNKSYSTNEEFNFIFEPSSGLMLEQHLVFDDLSTQKNGIIVLTDLKVENSVIEFHIVDGVISEIIFPKNKDSLLYKLNSDDGTSFWECMNILFGSCISDPECAFICGVLWKYCISAMAVACFIISIR